MEQINYITEELLYFYRESIAHKGKVITTPKIFLLLAKGNYLTDSELKQVEIAKSDTVINAEMTAIDKILKRLCKA